MLTPEQKEWVAAIRKSVAVKPKLSHEPPGALRRSALRVVESTRFELLVMGAILLNVSIMATFHCRPSDAEERCVLGDTWAQVWLASNYFFTAVFICEMLLKLFALGAFYFRSGWNCFDFFLVVASVVDIVTEVVLTAIAFNPTILRVLRIFRIGRLLRLVKQAQGLRRLLLTLVTSLPSLINVASLLMLLMLVYSVLGVALFRDVAFGEYLNRHANFQTLPVAYMLLFRCVTGESWNGIMHDAMITQAHDRNRCSDAAGDCGTPAAALIYFISYMLIAELILLNLVLAVVLQNFGQLRSENAKVISDWLLRLCAIHDPNTEGRCVASMCHAPECRYRYRIEWSRLDPSATGNAPSSLLMGMLCRLPEPIGFFDEEKRAVTMTRGKRLARLRELRVPDNGGFVNFQELLQALTRHAHRDQHLPESFGQAMGLARKMELARRRCNIDKTPDPEFSQDEVYAALLFQAGWRGRSIRTTARETSYPSCDAASTWRACRSSETLDPNLSQTQCRETIGYKSSGEA